MMHSSKSVPSLKIPGWSKAELVTPIDRVIRAKEIGKHHARIHDQRADIDNDTPRIEHYQKLRQRLFTIKQQTFNKKIQNDNIELLRHLITLSQDEPNYKTYPKNHHMIFSDKMNKLARKRRKKQIEKENQALKDRLGSIKPSKSLKTQQMARDFKKHQKLQRQFLFSKNQKRKQPDVIEYRRKKLSKKDRTHFMKPLDRPKTPDMVQKQHSSKMPPRPMTPNTYKYNLNKARKQEKRENGSSHSNKQKKRRRVQSARRNKRTNSNHSRDQSLECSPPRGHYGAENKENKQFPGSCSGSRTARNHRTRSSRTPIQSSRKSIQSARPRRNLTNLLVDTNKCTPLTPEKDFMSHSNAKNNVRARTSRSSFARSKSMRAERREQSQHAHYPLSTARSHSRKNAKWEDILAEDMSDFGVQTSPRTMKKLSKGLNTSSKFRVTVTTTSPLGHKGQKEPEYIMRASKIYDHKNRERARSHM